MTKNFKIKIIVSIFLFLGWINISYALSDYTLLTKLPYVSGENDCDASGCKTNLEKYFPGAIKLAMGVASVMAFVMITYGGVLYMTTDSITGKETGKGYIENALWGLLLVIGSYAILYTLNPQMLNFDLSVNKISVQNTLSSINTSKDLLPETKNALSDLINKCNCSPRITSTTGDTHSANSLHYQGKAVDMSSNTTVDAFIKKGTQGTSNGCTTYTQTLGGKTTVFLYEEKGQKCGGTVPSTGTHWHVSVL